MDFTTKLNQLVLRVNHALDELVPPHPGPQTGPARIHAAMRYSLQAGGKRLRPVLLLVAADLFEKPAPNHQPSASNSQPSTLNASALPAAVAIECVHTYSLIHDDLPCMDNDDLRRGRPTAHRQFDEATALLAGDALLTHAFLLLTTHYAGDPRLATALVRELADASGGARLIGGQMQDLLAEKKTDATAADLDF